MLIGVIMGIDPNTVSIARGMAFGIMTTIMLG
jgi:DNA-binding CsgD family transcriptional regulator